MLIAASPDEQARSFLAPSVCILCEQSLTALQKAARIVDTALDYWPQGHESSRLLGRKYVCEGCAHHVALALGYVTGVEFAAVSSHVSKLQTDLAAATKMADIHDVVAVAINDALASATAKKGRSSGITA